MTTSLLLNESRVICKERIRYGPCYVKMAVDLAPLRGNIYFFFSFRRQDQNLSRILDFFSLNDLTLWQVVQEEKKTFL